MFGGSLVSISICKFPYHLLLVRSPDAYNWMHAAGERRPLKPAPGQNSRHSATADLPAANARGKVQPEHSCRNPCKLATNQRFRTARTPVAQSCKAPGTFSPRSAEILAVLVSLRGRKGHATSFTSGALKVSTSAPGHGQAILQESFISLLCSGDRSRGFTCQSVTHF